MTIRLLDPPLHEFLPHAEDLVLEIDRRLAVPGRDPTTDLERELRRVRELEETNPMLGTRGCRLGLLFPEIYEVQVKAIVSAAVVVRLRGRARLQLEIMIPLVDFAQELSELRELVERAAAQVAEELATTPVPFSVGTMIELPRACLIADRLARDAAFFSFGTNDLTQTALGFSRDDAEGRFLTEYLRRRIVDRSPFETIDREGVGELLMTAVERGRRSPTRARFGHLRRAWRRSGQHRLLPRGRARLRQLFAVSGPDRPRRGGPGRDRYAVASERAQSSNSSSDP